MLLPLVLPYLSSGLGRWKFNSFLYVLTLISYIDVRYTTLQIHFKSNFGKVWHTIEAC
jgi:hypothetical protein